jgi:Replication-relaxation
MQPTPTKSKMQNRLKRFIRQPDRLAGRKITDKGLEALTVIARYRFVPSSMLVRLMSGDSKNNYRNLQTLFHRGVTQRFALPKYGGPGEFIYYLDSPATLDLLIDAGRLQLTDDQKARHLEVIRYNRDKNYSQLHRDPEAQGKVLFINHELMVSRFVFMLEMACRKLAGNVELEQWIKGPELWNRVECPKVIKERDADQWREMKETEQLPHRPDLFFTLRFPKNPPERERSHFFYEADRGTENTTRFKVKLRAHWHFIVKQNLHRTTAPYNVHSIRAVLTETSDSNWAHQLREAARHPVISPKPSPLFWFTTSELFFSRPAAPTEKRKPLYLDQPELVFRRLWASPVDDKLLNLAD